MTDRELLDALLKAGTIKDLEAAIYAFRAANDDAVGETPFGKRPNNRGAVEVASDAGRSIIERVTNGQDALLELEHDLHGGKPECHSPREAAAAWLMVPQNKGLAGLTNAERQQLAQ